MAKYLVVQEPGVPIPGVGFFGMEEVFSMPDDWLPSRMLVPLDEGAVAAITRAKVQYVADLEQRMSELDPPKKLSEVAKKNLLFVKPIGAVPVEEKPRDEGLTLRQAAGELPTPSKQGGGKRAADR